MFVTITDAAQKIIEKHLPGVLVLDLDDGVGNYSKAGSCDIGTAYQFFVADEKSDLSVYNDSIDSSMGKLLIKKHSREYMDPKMKIDFDEHYHMLNLTSPTTGILTPRMAIRNISDSKIIATAKL